MDIENYFQRGLLWQAIRDAFGHLKVRILMILSFILVSTATVFYHFQEGWGWIDAFYFSMITISTVGYGDFSPQTPAGKLFTVAYLVVGIGLFVVATAAFAEQLLQHIRTELLAEHHRTRSTSEHTRDQD